MILLDSDHLTALKYRGSERYVRLTERLQAVADEPIGTTIVNVEEQMRGWLASLAKERIVLRQVHAYRELAALFEFISKFHVASSLSKRRCDFKIYEQLASTLGRWI